MIKRKYLFIHVPKTAGTSVLTALGVPPKRRHISWRLYQQANEYYFNEFYKFAFVRDPVTRIYSSYLYILNGGNGSKSDLLMSSYIRRNAATFDAFVREYLLSGGTVLHNLFRPQAYFLCNFQREIMVDKLFKLESIVDDFYTLKQDLALSIHKLPSINVANRHFNREELAPDISDIIQDLYSIDFEVFGY